MAASNAREARSFIGQNYAFRPYFRRALAEGAGSQFALGTISGRPGLYLTRRLPEAPGRRRGQDRVRRGRGGVAAGRETAFVTDPRGIVLVASNPDWRFRSLRPIAPDERARIRESLEFGEAPLARRCPLHPVEDRQDLVRVGNGALAGSAPPSSSRARSPEPAGSSTP